MFLEVPPQPPRTTWRWGFWSSAVVVNNSLEREQDACWLAGTAGVLEIAGNMVTISLIAVSAGCFTFIPSSASRDFLWRGGGIIVFYSECSLLFYLSAFTWWLSLNLLSTPLAPLQISLYSTFSPLPFLPCCFCLPSCIPALLINNSSRCFSLFCISFFSLNHLEDIHAS